ncbi:MAG: nucleotidyltransferase family protein [Parcubacteria group bacterium]|nr:nucleotidyltransferase family protein [Parcubacteria group bacterium]
MQTLTFEQIQQKTTPIFQHNEVEFAGLFGSYSRGEAAADSDVDILVRFRKQKSLLGIIGMENQLSDVLGKKVDLVTEKFLSRYFRDDVIRHTISLYEG